MPTRPKKYGYSYSVTKEQIAAYQKLPIKERLRWLEEAQEFIAATLTKKQLELLQKFRLGDI